MSLWTYALVHVFTALLPPADDDDDEPTFYDILGVPKHAKMDEIRTAYRKKSLQLHPDKVAQRGEDAATAAAQYEKVQEAYGVLQDAQRRKEYMALGCSNARYRFVHSGQMSHPMVLWENLGRASWCDKLKLVGLCGMALCVLWLQPILVAAKLNQVLENQDEGGDDAGQLYDTPWVVILIPLWILQGLTVLFWMLVWCVVPAQAKATAVLAVAEHVCWLVGTIFLAQQWDRTRFMNWHALSVPFYFGVALKVLHRSNAAATLRSEQIKLRSPEGLQREFEGNFDDLTAEQQEELQRTFTVVTVDEEQVAATLNFLRAQAAQTISDDDVEMIKIQTSPEYQELDAAIQSGLHSMGCWIVFGIPTIALIAAKLQGQISASWWLVFLPILIYLGQRLLRTMVLCCCLAPREVEIRDGSSQDDGEEAGDVEQGKDVLKSSTKFAATEGSMGEFRDDGSDQSNPPPIEPVSSKSQDEEDEENYMRTSIFEKYKRRQRKTGAPFDEEPVSESDMSKIEAMAGANVDYRTDEENQTSLPPPAPRDGNNADNGDGAAAAPAEDKTGKGSFDEEAFRAWQRAKQREDSEVMEAASHAQGECLWTTILLITICLVIAKLEDEYDGDDGFDTFWILFVPFLLTGLLLCCCCVLIFGAGYASLHETMANDAALADHTDAANDGANDGDGVAPARESKMARPPAPLPVTPTTAAGAVVPDEPPTDEETLNLVAASDVEDNLTDDDGVGGNDDAINVDMSAFHSDDVDVDAITAEMDQEVTQAGIDTEAAVVAPTEVADATVVSRMTEAGADGSDDKKTIPPDDMNEID